MDTTPEPTPTNPAEDPLTTAYFPNGAPTVPDPLAASDVVPAPTEGWPAAETPVASPVSEDPADDPLLVNNSVRALIGKEIARLYALAAQSGLLNRLHLKGSHLSDEAK